MLDLFTRVHYTPDSELFHTRPDCSFFFVRRRENRSPRHARLGSILVTGRTACPRCAKHLALTPNQVTKILQATMSPPAVAA